MRKFTGSIRTNKVGSVCEFEFEVDDDMTDDEIESLARQCAFDLIDWHYEEVQDE